jgi:hypothetical protein
MNLLKLTKIPASIKEDEIITGNPPKEYEAFLYKYTNLNNGKMYVGIHKGQVGDGYWHSSTKKEFNEVFSSQEPTLKLEILRYGSYDAMQLAESRILHSANAKENPEYYNGSNGMKPNSEVAPDVEYMQILVDKIQNQDGLVVTIEPIEDVAVLKRLQVRFEEDEAHKREIRERIEDAGGDTSGCSPIVIYEGRGINGEDIIGDGNHTVNAASEAKHCTKIPVIRIPKDIHKSYTDAELKGVGSLLNKKPDLIKKPVSIDDAVKQIEDIVNNGTTLEQFAKDEHSHRQYLQLCGFTNKQVGKIISRVKNSIKHQEFLKANKLWVDYSKKGHKETLKRVTENFRTSDTMAIHVSSAMFKWDDVINTLWAAGSEDGKKGRIKTKNKMVVVVHHTSPDKETNWKKNIQPQILNKIDLFFTKLGYDIRIHEMPTTMTNNPFLNNEY